MVRIKPTRGLALAVVALVAGVVGPEIASGSPGPSASAYNAVNPIRVVDTRTGVGGSTMGPGSVLTVALAGAVGGVSGDANAVAMNVTVANGSTTSFLTVWPAGMAKPDASSLNWSDVAPRANSVTSKLGTDGAISLFNERGTVDVIIDVVGYYETTYVEPAASTTPYVADANGARIGDLVGVAGESFTVLGDDGYIYPIAAATGQVWTNDATELFLTSDCTGPSLFSIDMAQPTPQMLVQVRPATGAGQPVYVTGAVQTGYDAQSFRSWDGNCYPDGNSPVTVVEIMGHENLPSFPAPLTIQR